MKKFDRNKYQSTSAFYLLLLLLTGIALFIGWFTISDHITNLSSSARQTVLTPAETQVLSDATTIYQFTGIQWTTKAATLLFYTQNQAVEVKADGNLLYSRYPAKDSFVYTTGRNCEMVMIPQKTQTVSVTVTNCDPRKRVLTPVFYQGDGVSMFRNELLRSNASLILGILNTALGVLMLTYWLLVHRWAYVSKSLLYLGILTAELGVWFCLETGSAILLMPNPVFRSYTTRLLLALMSIPFLLFTRYYLHAKDKYLYRILTGLGIVELLLVLVLQFTKIASVMRTLWMSQIMMVLAVFYFIYTIVYKFRHQERSHALWICTIGSIILISAMFSDLVSYYTSAQNVGVAGRAAMFLFLLLLSGDTAYVSLRAVDSGRKAAAYRELAEKDLLTGCYNRNAYYGDTHGSMDLHGLTFAAFDLNNLKYYNDTFGHHCGDTYITDAVQILQRVFRKYGKLYRMGGDEFCVLLTDVSEDQLHELTERLRREEALYNAASHQIFLQIACGYATYDPACDRNLDDLKKRADDRMYENKKELKTFSYR